MRASLALCRALERVASASSIVSTSARRAARALRPAPRPGPCSLRRGSITRSMPARGAASTFSLMPPTGSTRPRSEISPVIATLPRARRPESAERIAVASATPAEGPSFGTAPAGTCRWISPPRERRRRRGRSARRCARTQESAASADSRITSPSWPGEPQAHALAARDRRGLDEEDVAAVRRSRASPTTTPGTRRCARRVSGRCGGAPSASRDERGVDARSAPPSRRSAGDPRAPPCASASRSGARGCARRPRACTRAPRARSASSSTLDLLGREAVRLELLRDQVRARDRELVAVGVARELDHLHAVEERRRDRGERVRGRDEEHAREVEGHLEVVVA